VQKNTYGLIFKKLEAKIKALEDGQTQTQTKNIKRFHAYITPSVYPEEEEENFPSERNNNPMVWENIIPVGMGWMDTNLLIPKDIEEEIDQELNKDPLYIVIWKDCKDCTELLKNMDQKKIRYFYLNIEKANVYVYDGDNLDGEDAEDHLRKLRQEIQEEQSSKKVWKNLEYVKDELEVPMFYKNENYLGNTLMDIYSEIYPI
jgi:hypothetical protein